MMSVKPSRRTAAILAGLVGVLVFGVHIVGSRGQGDWPDIAFLRTALAAQVGTEEVSSHHPSTYFPNT